MKLQFGGGEKIYTINDFDGNTFVAYIDISGFKELMKRKKQSALNALNSFYYIGFKTIDDIQNSNGGVEGQFISDCGILFVNTNRINSSNYADYLKSLLFAIKRINLEMIHKNYMLTTSISYGHFRYQNMIEPEGMRKNPIFGEGYVNAYFDNERGSPKIQPGECRILKKAIPDGLIQTLNNPPNDDSPLNLIKKRKDDKSHYYFYWMVNQREEIEEFESKYKNAIKSMYDNIKRILRHDW